MGFGLELAFYSARPFHQKGDCLIAYIHWKLLSQGFRCLPFGEQNEVIDGSELLPQGWNAEPGVYELKYIQDGQLYLLKATDVEGQLFFTVLRMKDEKTVDFVLDTNLWIGENYLTLKEAFKDQAGLEAFVEKELISILVKTNSPPKPVPCAVGRSDENIPPFSTPTFSAPSSSIPSGPLAIGGGDLDPLGRGIGGGMLMDPRRFVRPQSGIPPNLPPGAVPPGARFDPFGPPDLLPPTQPRPRPRGGFADPDPDHLPPPY